MTFTSTLKEFSELFVNKLDFEFEKRGKYYFLKNDNFKIPSESLVVMPGLPLGTEGKFFEPSLFLLELLSKKTKNKIFINNQAEWLFLCGRDVFLDNVSNNNATGKIFLVQNERNENLGLGVRTKSKGKNIIKNLIDRGDFLRREK